MATVVFDVNTLPTPVANTANRVNVLGINGSADTFLATSYVFEAFLKTVVLALRAGLDTRHREHAYKIGHALVRADGLGVWHESLQQMTKPPVSGFIPTEMVSLLQWATAKQNKSKATWAHESFEAASRILDSLGTEFETPSKLNVGHVLSACVQIRNKTKAHGAVGEDFYSTCNHDYVSAVRSLVSNCPAMTWTWVRVYRTPANELRVVHLNATSPTRLQDEGSRLFHSVEPEGIYLIPENSSTAFACGALFRCDRQCRSFYWPNGGFSTTTSKAEFLDYATGVVKTCEANDFISPPAPLPESETHASFSFDLQSNVFGNLPPQPEKYVQRPKLQEELLSRLNDRNHPIITLHGRGGVGKTYLALYAAHSLSNASPALFECIVWLSARDIDLRAGGPASVRQDVVKLDEICKAVGELFGIKGDADSFASLLQNPKDCVSSGKGVLFILDNFETLTEVRTIHEFLDLHTHLPNKVLITSRERAFKADFPIEVRGMERSEAVALLRATAIELEIADLMDETRMEELFEYTEGHAFVMRVLAGEMAKEKRNIPLKTVLPKRIDIVQAVFERSFNKLSDAGRRVFLVVSGFRSVITELSLIVVLGLRGADVEEGIDECVRLSLVEAVELSDGTFGQGIRS